MHQVIPPLHAESIRSLVKISVKQYLNCYYGFHPQRSHGYLCHLNQ